MDVIDEAPSLVLYCGGYECSDAIDLAERLLEIGHPDIRLFEQGLRAWVDAGGDTREGSDP
jgi:3-mercaptopyruvate sulfurtransferase SseA